jgi:hypothetical protein
MKKPPLLSTNTDAQTVIKRPDPVKVFFAEKPGSVETLEGHVRYRAEDALVKGKMNDQWPIQRHKFLETYDPVPPTKAGDPGSYIKKPIKVLALQLTEPIEVPVGWQNDPLHGEPGDWLIQYGPDDYGIVKSEIFDATYEIIDDE